MVRPSWWPDWRGECVAIIASGPSTKHVELAALRDRIHVIAIKENINLCPWAEVVYGCDGAWWSHRSGLPDFSGLKISYDAAACDKFGLRKIEIEKFTDEILLGTPGKIGSGGNSGFQALNLAVQFGATGILLIGFDMHDRNGAHWYGRNTWPMANNPDWLGFERFVKAFNAAAPKLKRMDIDVVNASPFSVLTCFLRSDVEGTLRGWGL